MAVVEAGEQGVWRLLVVLVSVLAGEGVSGPGPFGVAHAPARDAHLMAALVADVAVAGIPEPVPVVLETQFVERAHGRRSQEEIPIHAGRGGLVLGVADGIAALEAQALRLVDLADETLLHGGDSLHLERRAAMLRANLHEFSGGALHLHHLLAFVDVVAGGLLALHIFTRLPPPHTGHGRPIISTP